MKEKLTLTSKIFKHIAHAIHPEKNQTYTSNKYSFSILAIILSTLLLPPTANAHRGARGEIDTCRISVGKEVIHFSAYTPSLSGGRSFCHVIPEIGLTDLVIDYEGQKLRQTTVEFEVTKEPEGSRVYYHKPEKIKKGSINAKVDFRQHGAGEYLLHVTIINQGETLDSHLPFSVGIEPEESLIPIKILIPLIIIIILLAVIFSLPNKPKEEE